MTATTPPASRDDAERLVEIRDRLSRGDLTYSRHEELATLFIAIDDRDASLAAANAELDGARAEISTLRKQLADAEIDANTEAEPELARLRSAAPSGAAVREAATHAVTIYEAWREGAVSNNGLMDIMKNLSDALDATPSGDLRAEMYEVEKTLARLSLEKAKLQEAHDNLHAENERLRAALVVLDQVFEFSDENIPLNWNFEGVAGVKQAFAQARAAPDTGTRGKDAETAPERLALGYCPIHHVYHRNAWCEHHYGAGPLNPENAPSPSPEAAPPYPGETYLAHQDEWNRPPPPDRTELNAWLEIAENTRDDATAYKRLRAAVNLRINAGHNDTCDYMLTDPVGKYACTCGHSALVAETFVSLKATHALHRTSPKGEPFIGTCSKCGTPNLGINAAREECSNIRGTTQETDLLKAIDPKEKQDE